MLESMWSQICGWGSISVSFYQIYSVAQIINLECLILLFPPTMASVLSSKDGWCTWLETCSPLYYYMFMFVKLSRHSQC